jgi:hypothetical protein
MDRDNEKNKEEIIKAIWGLTEFIDINEDDGSDTTLEMLKQKDLVELIDLFEEIIELIEKEANNTFS